MHKIEEFYHSHKKIFEYALYQIRTKGYSEKIITKKNGGQRKLNIPPTFAKVVQKKLNTLLQDIYIPPKPVHGFIKSYKFDTKNIVSNALKHTKKSIVINVDIENFFNTVNFGRVRGLFISKPFEIDKDIATRLAQLTVFNNELPQGAPTSPIITNLICKKMDFQLLKVAKENSLVFSRYADDITFSTNKQNINIENIISDIEQVIVDNGFKINTSKTRVQLQNQTQTVTGLKVNQKVNLDRKYIRQIRSMLFSWYTDGLKEAAEKHFEKFNKQPDKYLTDLESSFKNILIGKINFLGQVKGRDNFLYIKYRHTFYLLDSNFSLSKKLNEFEKLDLNHLNQRCVTTIFTQIYSSILVFTEGITDIMYMKKALKYFQEKGKYEGLHLRYCNLESWSNVSNIHKVFYENQKDLSIINMRKCILPYVKDDLKFCFILDADDRNIKQYFERYKHTNYFLIDDDRSGYIEKLFEQGIVIDKIKKLGYTIDTTKEGLQKSTIKALKEYVSSELVTEEAIHSIPSTSYIAYKDKIIKKTDLANFITKDDSVTYDDFESIFVYLDSMKHNKDYVKPLCCNSLY
ncbi:reverse transcriptase domain-containing protein [Sulfurimonas xiamenensis]|uniref:RNA-directed DNA polymerase n=1 Tax=Sulfurimonas xiamenensis TaxID=2590021 RepID=A0AAJ4A2V9_9BACT|nr:reverse transcriptase domain-containing protein [Sulfurimonas xiamenensis]QFR42866.1 RNA-directed DNA polymerase [Sulfurimonas xiamenensis]